MRKVLITVEAIPYETVKEVGGKEGKVMKCEEYVAGYCRKKIKYKSILK